MLKLKLDKRPLKGEPIFIYDKDCNSSCRFNNWQEAKKTLLKNEMFAVGAFDVFQYEKDGEIRDLLIIDDVTQYRKD